MTGYDEYSSLNTALMCEIIKTTRPYIIFFFNFNLNLAPGYIY